MSADVTPLVEAFPDNDKYYVVWAFGNLKKNSSDKSTSPLVEVMLREMDSIYLPNPDFGGYGEFGKNEKYGMGETVVCLISIEELDIVSLGSKWHSKSKLGDSYDFVEYEKIPLRLTYLNVKLIQLNIFLGGQKVIKPTYLIKNSLCMV